MDSAVCDLQGDLSIIEVQLRMALARMERETRLPPNVQADLVNVNAMKLDLLHRLQSALQKRPTPALIDTTRDFVFNWRQQEQWIRTTGFDREAIPDVVPPEV